MLKAAQKLVEANALPVNLRFAFDGEEEIGGTTIVDWIERDETRRGRGRHLRRRDDPHRRAGVQPRDARPDRLRPQGDDGRARPPLGDVRRRGAQRDPRADAVPRRPCSAGENGLLPEPLRQGIVAPTAEELAGWEALPSGADELALAGARPLDPERGGAVQHPHARRAVRRRERDHRRQAGRPEHDALGPRGRRGDDPPRAGPGGAT